MDAQGALDSLLGRLTTILADEARLLGGLQGDVEFIKDEMESMNGLLLHLTEARQRDHQVRAWMKQVVGLTRDCEGNVELYIHSVTNAGHHASGFLGYLGHVIRYVRTIPERHRIAMRIRELKVRARDVGDRKLRYGVTVPPAVDQDDAIFMDGIHKLQGAEDEEEDARRRSLLVNCLEDEDAYIEKIIDDTIKVLLSEDETVIELANGDSQPRIFIMTYDKYLLSEYLFINDYGFIEFITQKLHERQMSSFHCRVLVNCYTTESWSRGCTVSKPVVQLLREILHQVAPLSVEQDVLRVEAEKSMETSPGDDEVMQLTKKLEEYLKGKRFLIILRDVNSMEPGDSISSTVLHATAHASPGSVAVIVRHDDHLLEPPYKILKVQSQLGIFYNKTMELMGHFRNAESCIPKVLQICCKDVFAMKMFQRLLYVNPRRSLAQMENIESTLSGCGCSDKSVAKQMVKISYNELPAKYRSCLLYLTIFPEGEHIRRTTVCRRWIAEGLVTSREKHAEDEADCCFRALLSRGLVQPEEIGDMSKIKTCTLHNVVHEVISRIARDLSFVDMDLPCHLARHFSIHSRIGAKAFHAERSVQAADGNGIVASLAYLANSSQWRLMKMLDLEGCRGLNEQHLKSICKIILLKYLSLRNTDITKLPKQIEKLQCLETLDIRQTAVRALATRSIKLPMLKRLLSGQEGSPNNFDRFQELFTAMRLPSDIRGMKKLEILSRVEVSDNADELIDVGHLLHLRKLGVILSGKKGGLGLLFQQIEKLHGCLRSLSIQINEPPKVEDTLGAEEVTALVSPPKLLQSLNVSGIVSGLLLWIAELDQLTKITLSETSLGEDYRRILGKLAALRCLRLQRNTYAGSRLTLKDGEFRSLKSLVVHDGIITNITFDTGAAPRLETIVWSFAKMESISGVLCLPKLMKLELNGDCNPDPVRQELEEHTNRVDFKHKPGHGHQEDGATVAASTSMSK